MKYLFTIRGEPVAKGRPLFTSFGGHARAYTPKKTRDAENNMRAQIVNQLPKDFKIMAGNPIVISIWVYRQKPKSAKKSVLYPITRPDTDNYVKTILDCMNTVVFEDDALIVELHAEKLFGVPGVEIEIEEML